MTALLAGLPSLGRLREASCAVTDLAESAAMEPSAILTSCVCCVTWSWSRAPLRKNFVYALCDNHVAALLDQAVYHIEHLRLGIADTPAARRQLVPAYQRDPDLLTASAD